MLHLLRIKHEGILAGSSFLLNTRSFLAIGSGPSVDTHVTMQANGDVVQYRVGEAKRFGVRRLHSRERSEITSCDQFRAKCVSPSRFAKGVMSSL